MSKLRVIAFSILLFGGAFSIFSLIFNFGDWHRLAFVSAAGIFIGVVAAPSIEPKAFKLAWAYELGFGCLAGAALGWVLGTSVELMGIGALVGAMLGYLAPYWVKHVHIP
jgi:hypothetical protein